MSKADVSKAGSAASIADQTVDDDWDTKPEFIYGGPFIKQEKPSPLLGTATPINMQLQGTFKKSFAYYSLKERMPVILTKVIDYCSREGAKIKSANSASDEDLRNFIQYLSKLKNDLVTNKPYDLLTVDSPEARKWNEWIQNAENQYYFTNVWVFTECYVYRRLREGCELQKGLKNFDPFDEQKQKSFTTSLEPMCVAAEKVVTMLPESDKDKRKADFMTLLKLSLWANKCDLSLSMGAQVSLKGEVSEPDPGAANPATAKSKVTIEDTSLMDPFQMIIDLKDKVLVDDSAKIADAVVAKAETIAKAIEGAPAPPSKTSSAVAATGSPPAPASPRAADEEGEEAPKVPCPAKMVLPQAVMFDIVCDNAGYELFADLCLAHFLVAQKIVQKIRFHVKKIPWFVSDVTPADFKYLISQCKAASFNKEIPQEPKSDAEPDAPPEPPRRVSANDLHTLADQWQAYVDDGTFVVMCDDFWTSPHVYKDMKKYDYNLYRKLQYAIAVLFKGDLNYRKLLGERNCNSTLGFEPALQGFTPAPVIALRTVKADLICGLPKGRADQLNKIDEQWMQKGDYGVIQFCAKAEALKVADRPCLDYGDTCFGTICLVHNDM